MCLTPLCSRQSINKPSHLGLLVEMSRNLKFPLLVKFCSLLFLFLFSKILINQSTRADTKSCKMELLITVIVDKAGNFQWISTEKCLCSYRDDFKICLYHHDLKFWAESFTDRLVCTIVHTWTYQLKLRNWKLIYWVRKLLCVYLC